MSAFQNIECKYCVSRKAQPAEPRQLTEDETENASTSLAQSREGTFIHAAAALDDKHHFSSLIWRSSKDVLQNLTAVGAQNLGLMRVGIVKELWKNLKLQMTESFQITFRESEINKLKYAALMTTSVALPSVKSSPNELPHSSNTEIGNTLVESVESDGNSFTTNVTNSPTISPGKAILMDPVLDNMDLKSASVLRLSAVRELLDTEVNYVKILTSICECYLPAMSKRTDIFAPYSIRLIFSNIATIYRFQLKFLTELRKCVEQNQIAKVFLKMHKGFLCYSTYCNSYSRAHMELKSYDRIKDAHIIWENCRKTENLREYALAAHLMSPVQRICRYPLHLGELLKISNKISEDESNSYADMKPKLDQLEQSDASRVDLPDSYQAIEMALEAMKNITEAVNEGKRHSEIIAGHQSSFRNFKGPPLHLHSTRFFLQIDATRQKSNHRNSSCILFLFENQLIYCKRNIIKRSQFIYKGRIFIDRCRVVNVPDGNMFGQTLENVLRIHCYARDKWYNFRFRSANCKKTFLQALALERQFGGKAMCVSEMIGFNYEPTTVDIKVSGPGGIASAVVGEYSDLSDGDFSETTRGYASSEYLPNIGSGSGYSSPKNVYVGTSSTLPKKSKSGHSHSLYSETLKGSLRRCRIGNWLLRPNEKFESQ